MPGRHFDRDEGSKKYPGNQFVDVAQMFSSMTWRTTLAGTPVPDLACFRNEPLIITPCMGRGLMCSQKSFCCVLMGFSAGLRDPHSSDQLSYDLVVSLALLKY